MFILEAIGNFFKAIWYGICWLVGAAIRYFLVYLPVLVMAGFAIFWVFHPDGFDFDPWLPGEIIETYNYKLTVMSANWLVDNAEVVGLVSFVLIHVFFIIKLAILIVAAIFETIVVYILYALLLSFVLIIIYFVLLIAVFLVLPAAAVVYSGILIKYSDGYNRWFYILCLLLTLGFSVMCYMYAIPAI